MTQLIITQMNILQDALEGLASLFKTLKQQIEYSRKVNRTMKELSSLSDHELNDIGLSRGDIYGVAREDATLERVRRTAVDENSNLKGWV